MLDKLLEYTIFNSIVLFLPFVFTYYLIFYFEDKQLKVKESIIILILITILVAFILSYIVVLNINPETNFIYDYLFIILDILTIASIFVTYLIKQKYFSFNIFFTFFIVYFICVFYNFLTLIFAGKLIQELSLIQYTIFAIISSGIYYMIVIFTVKKTDLLGKYNYFFNSRTKKIILAFSLFIVSMLLQLSSLFFRDNYSIYYSLLAIIIFVVYISFVISIAYSQRTKEVLKTKEALLLQQDEYLQTLENIQREIKTFQHDYKNVLSAMYLQVNEGNYEAAQEYLSNVIDRFDSSLVNKIKQTTNLANIEQIELKSLILTKIIRLEQLEVNYQLEVIKTIKEINMRTDDLIVAVGILLDNAIESCQKGDTVKISLINDDELIIIIIANPYYDEINLNEIYIGGISTKGAERGLGLYSYKKIIDQYSNVFKETRLENKQFIQLLHIK